VTNADVDHAAAFFFLSAQRFFIAAPIFRLAAADSRRFRPSALPDAVITRLFWLPRRAAMALLSRSRSLSNSAMIDCVSNGVALLVFRVATILQD
jgi:hypothetical protein